MDLGRDAACEERFPCAALASTRDGTNAERDARGRNEHSASARRCSSSAAHVRSVPASWLARSSEPSMDVAIASSALTSRSLSPILLLAAARRRSCAVSPGSRRSFRQDRVGLRRPFGSRLFKLRTMHVGSHLAARRDAAAERSSTVPVMKIRNDPRLHPSSGRVLAPHESSTSSLISDQRPARRDVRSSVRGRRCRAKSRTLRRVRARRRLTVKPGVTCLWQISADARACSFDEWMRLDNEYVDTWSPLRDLAIVASKRFPR